MKKAVRSMKQEWKIWKFHQRLKRRFMVVRNRSSCCTAIGKHGEIFKSIPDYKTIIMFSRWIFFLSKSESSNSYAILSKISADGRAFNHCLNESKHNFQNFLAIWFQFLLNYRCVKKSKTLVLSKFPGLRLLGIKTISQPHLAWYGSIDHNDAQ